MTRRITIAFILFFAALSAVADESDKVKPNTAWEGAAHIKGDVLTLIATNTSEDCAYVRIGSLSDNPIASHPEAMNESPRLRLSCLYAISDYTVKILWPVKSGSELVTGNEMMRFEINSKAICDLVRKKNIQEIELVLSVIDLPLEQGVVKEHKQIVQCRVILSDLTK